MKKGVIFEKQPLRPWRILVYFCLGIILGLIILLFYLVYSFESNYQDKIYPGIKVDGVDVGSKKKSFVLNYINKKNNNLDGLILTLIYNQPIATISAKGLDVGYDSNLYAEQAFSVGRSGNFLTDIYLIILAAKYGINLPISQNIDEQKLTRVLNNLSQKINVAPKEGLFQFSSGRVVAFKTSENGLALDIEKAQKDILEIFKKQNAQVYNLPTKIVLPKVTTENSNDLGIKELVGRGSSTFYHSIDNRVFNIGLAASRINGILIAPGTTFSFNDAVGNISDLTGYRQAYIIKDGKTILGDGGGVCQVSTTLFRAAINAGLPIIERWAHSYRVGYYEQDSPVGVDATVFSPDNDLKIKNDTTSYILIQNTFDAENYSLEFDLYGQKDGRKVSLSKPIITNQTPPPPDLYQDDLALPKNTIKQIDFSAWGAKVSFDYQVEKDDKILFQKTFVSDYLPWQAVYLKGTKE